MSNPRMLIMQLILIYINIAYSYPQRNPKILLVNFTQCFDIINATTIEKKLFFYNNTQTKEQCTKIALVEKYKEDIFFPRYLHKCFPLCNSCSDYSKKKNNMKCLSCYRGFILENGNCYLNRKYNSKQRLKELRIILNTLNMDPKINSNDIIKKNINGKIYYFKEHQISNYNFPKLRKLYIKDDLDDSQNAIFNREDQSTLTNDKTDFAYNFHIELSPYYFIAQRCISKGKYFIENDRCVDECSPSLEKIFGYTEILIPVGPDNSVKVCDCAFRCCKKVLNDLYKSLDRGYIDGSYEYFRKLNGNCLFSPQSLDKLDKKNTYLLAQDLIPCFFPIYDDDGNFEFYFTGYQRTLVGNNCKTLCPVNDSEQYYYFNPENNGCYKCPENCIECDGIPTEDNGHCVKCKKAYQGIYNGFCVGICPNEYGMKNGICQKCGDDEIRIGNECFLNEGTNKQYGTEDNPTFLGDDGKIYQCLKYNQPGLYSIEINNANCRNAKCPPFFHKPRIGNTCNVCPDGCITCNSEGGRNPDCTSCTENYVLRETSCQLPLFQITENDNDYLSNKCKDTQYIKEKDGELPKCVESCDDGEYVNSEKTCDKCDGIGSNVVEGTCLKDCNDDYPEDVNGKCVDCKTIGMINYEGKCVQNDGDIYYPLSPWDIDHVDTCYVKSATGDLYNKKSVHMEYSETHCINDCPPGYIEKIDSNGIKYCSKCYETCETCIYTGSPGNHKCTECKVGYQWSDRMFGVCDQICQEGEFFYYEDTREKKCSSECPAHKPYMLEKENDDDTFIECIRNCTDNDQFFLENSFQCIKQCPEGYFTINLTCYSKCPEGYGPLFGLLECFDCMNYSLFYYDGNCVNITNGLPPNTYVLLDELKDE